MTITELIELDILILSDRAPFTQQDGDLSWKPNLVLRSVGTLIASDRQVLSVVWCRGSAPDYHPYLDVLSGEFPSLRYVYPVFTLSTADLALMRMIWGR